MATSREQREAYGEKTLEPFLRPLVEACLEEMPPDPRQFMNRWLADYVAKRSQAAPISSAPLDATVETPAAKGKGKAPPPKGKGNKGKGKLAAADSALPAAPEATEALAAATKGKSKDGCKGKSKTPLPPSTCEPAVEMAWHINSVNWTEVKTAKHLVGGKGGEHSGVHLLEFEGGHALCLRTQTELFPTEIVAERVARALKVPVARYRLVHPDLDRDEFELLHKERSRVAPSSMDLHLEQLKQNDPAQYEHVRRSWEQQRGSVAVLEYVQGVSLDTAPLATASEQLLQGLGRLCALDVLLNNAERLPLPIWDGTGNLTNAILRSSEEVVGIDQQVNAPKEDDSRERYLGRVRRLAQQLCVRRVRSLTQPGDGEEYAAQSPAAVSERLRSAFLCACNVELSTASLLAVNEGLRIGFTDVLLHLDSGALRTSLDDAVTEAGRRIKHGGSNEGLPPPAEDAKRQADFVMEIAKEVAEIVRKSGMH